MGNYIAFSQGGKLFFPLEKDMMGCVWGGEVQGRYDLF